MSNNFYGTYNGLPDDTFFDDVEPDDNPEFVAFMDHLAHDLKEYRDKAKLRVVNPVGYKNFEKAFVSLAKLIQKDNPDAEISYELNDVYDGGIASIWVTSYSLDIDNISLFVDAIKHSFGIGLMGSNEQGKIRMTISFKNVHDDIFVGDSLEDSNW